MNFITIFRCSSGTTESFKDKHASFKSRKNHIVSLTGGNADDKSSSESLNFGKLIFIFVLIIFREHYYIDYCFFVITGRFRTSSTCIPENHALVKEVRLVRPTKGVSFKDERLAIVPGQGVPCVIFSTIPYSKTVRNAR